MPSPPKSLKPILQHLKRANELEREGSTASRVVAYFCRKYAVSTGLQLRERDAATHQQATEFLVSVMDQLEQSAQSTSVPSDEDGKKAIRNFALTIFKRADDEDRAGRATKATAQTFLAASNFMDVLKQFGELDEDIKEKITYSKFKALDIIKAVKEGRQPTPGPPGGEELSTYELPSAGSDPIPPAPAHPSSAPAPAAGGFAFDLPGVPAHEPGAAAPAPAPAPAPAAPAPAPAPAPAAGGYGAAPAAGGYHAAPAAGGYAAPAAAPAPAAARGYAAAPTGAGIAAGVPAAPARGTAYTSSAASNTFKSADTMHDALEYAKFAVAALKTKETGLAIQRLRQALQLLES